jgi:hypothetical protein
MILQRKPRHHNLSPNDLNRHRGLAKDPKVALLGFEPGSAREGAYLNQLPEGTGVLLSLDGEAREGFNTCLLQEGGFTDVFIAGSGEDAVATYAAIETQLARSAAVNFVDGEANVPIRSRNAHYVTRHQICGKNVPWYMTNTSANPVSFDWMVKGVCGLQNVPTMMDEVEAAQPFGSFFAFAELEDLPWVETTASAFREAAEKADGSAKQALLAGADALASNNDVWGRNVEEALYEGYGLTHPLNLA